MCGRSKYTQQQTPAVSRFLQPVSVYFPTTVLSKGCRILGEVNFNGCDQLTDLSLRALVECSHLCCSHLERCPHYKDVESGLPQTLPLIELKRCAKITAAAVASFPLLEQGGDLEICTDHTIKTISNINKKGVESWALG